jgi:tetratricopeptide (TPR) repeat protein
LDCCANSFTRAARRQRLKELEAIVEENSAVGNLEELADLSFDEGQWARARELYDKLLKVSRPVSVDPYYRRGLSALALGDAVAAVPDLEKVVADEPKYDFYRATGMLALAYAQAGLADKADAQFRAATGISTLSETYFNYATFLDRPAAAGGGARVGAAHLWTRPGRSHALRSGRSGRGFERPGALEETRLASSATDTSTRSSSSTSRSDSQCPGCRPFCVDLVRVS